MVETVSGGNRSRWIARDGRPNSVGRDLSAHRHRSHRYSVAIRL